MNKLRNMLIAAISVAFLSTSAFAGSFGIGAAGSLAAIGGSGTETEGTAADTSVNTATASNNTYVGSVFAEYTFDNGFTIGADWIPGSADVNSKKISRTDTELSEQGDDIPDNDSATRTASAEVENHITYYAELPLGGSGLYAKAGFVQMDVNTTEKLFETSKYGNDTVDGMTVGLGFKVDSGSNWYYKLEANHTEFDTLTLKSTGNASESSANTIKADLDVTKATFALGYKF